MKTKTNLLYVIGGIVQELTKGKPYVFVVMPYKKKFELYEHIKKVVEEVSGLVCIRADDIPAAGHDLLAQLHLLIERAELVIAEISESSPNVFYEIGYAVGIQKPIIPIVEIGVEVPANLKGQLVIQYDGSREGMENLDKRLSEQIKAIVNSQIALLRDMLIADNPKPAYIIASPRYPEVKKHIKDQVLDARTFGDNLGILGLISDFGSIFGEHTDVELVSGQYCAPRIFSQPLNLYLIGSHKVNPPVKEMLKRLQKGREPNWFFAPPCGEKEEGDWQVCLYRKEKGETYIVEGETEQLEGGIVHTLDYGIIVRGPHPDYQDRLVLIMAGPHSLGSGAACLAATKSQFIRQIKFKIDIADKQKTFWVLVRGELSRKDRLLDIEGVSIIETGTYD